MAGEKTLKILSDIATADIKLSNLSGKTNRKVNGKEIEMKQDGSPQIVLKTAQGKECKFVRLSKGAVVEEVTNGYQDEDGNTYNKADLVPHYVTVDGEHIPASVNEKTEVFEIKTWEPVQNYLDKYQMDTYYQVKPSQGKSKSDFTRKQTYQANTIALKKLWDHMVKNQVVGKSVLNITSSGYLPSVAYLRAVEIDGKWTFEIAIFKQPKVFEWVEEKNLKLEPVKEAKKAVEVDEL